MDPANTTYAANVLVLNDDAFECLTVPVYRALLLQCNLYDLEVCKAVVSDPDTLLFDQILLDQTWTSGRNLQPRRSKHWKAKGLGRKSNA